MHSSDRYRIFRRPFYASFATVIVLLTACAAPAPQTTPATESVQLEAIEQSATDLQRQAELTRNPDEANHLRVLASLAWLREDQPERAEALLELVDLEALAPEDSYRFHTVQLRVYLAKDELLEALQFARSTSPSGVANVEVKNQWSMASADTYYLNYAFKDAATIYHECSEPVWSNRQPCRQGLWNSLSNLDRTGLDDLSNQESNPSFRGWIELARVAHLNLGDYTTQIEALRQWRQRYPIHTATRDMPAPLQDLQELAISAPRKIAVLLPLSGPLQSAGNDVLDGILSAYYASAARSPELHVITIYDTESLPFDLLLEILRSEDFDGIVGPLERERVDVLANASQVGIPVIALNQLNSSVENVFGIGLAIESEAHQAAERAAREGHHTAIVMAPDTPGGDRSANTFTTTWQELNQTVSAILRYTDNADQRATMLESALHIDQSNQRRSQLQGLLGKSLTFEPRRRADVDMMFMSASPDQARQITPLMAYNYAEDIPIYGTSSIYDGTLNTDLDRDLDGVNLLTYPWVFRDYENIATLPDTTAQISQASKSLQALGVDAYYLMRRFHQLQGYPSVVYQGLTGTLTPDLNGNIERRMDWATFRAGRISQTGF
jgi:outer membrane PBP1 activator LpoA protein